MSDMIKHTAEPYWVVIVSDLRAENAELKAKVDELKAEVTDLREAIDWVKDYYE